MTVAALITSTDLYCIGMESDTAYRLMPQLCEALGIAYPPEYDRTELDLKAADYPDPLSGAMT